MLKEAENKVVIEGILSENNLEHGSYTNKDGRNVECIRGSLVVKTEVVINEKVTPVEVSTKIFVNKLKNDGTPNKIYPSIETVMNDYVSIAAAGNEDDADRIRITGAKLTMNEYPSKATGEIVSFPQVTGNFITRVKKEEYKPDASFNLVFVVGDAKYEMDNEGIETGNYLITAIVPQYGGKVDVIPLKVVNPQAIDVISQYWTSGSTVKAAGKLCFTSTTVTTKTEVDFGEPEERSYTRRTSDLIITSGRQDPFEDEFAYDGGEIRTALTARKARLEEQKALAKSGATVRNAPAKNAAGGFDNLGF